MSAYSPTAMTQTDQEQLVGAQIHHQTSIACVWSTLAFGILLLLPLYVPYF